MGDSPTEPGKMEQSSEGPMDLTMPKGIENKVIILPPLGAAIQYLS